MKHVEENQVIGNPGGGVSLGLVVIYGLDPTLALAFCSSCHIFLQWGLVSLWIYIFQHAHTPTSALGSTRMINMSVILLLQNIYALAIIQL